ncbi:hypothetical protein BGZ58_001762 [Dissophora ornata]|nr:hypothetical protein BGZ58_001762 [Dissophora ornata]
MSSRDDDDQDLLKDALEQTTLDDPTDDTVTENAKTTTVAAASTTEESSSHQKSPVNGKDNNNQGGGSGGDQDNKRKEDTDDKEEDDDTPASSSTQGTVPTSISFATSESILGAEDNNTQQTPALTRRKSSLSTIGSRLKRASSAEKHVTIIDNTGDITATEGSTSHGEQVWDDKSNEDDAAKEELAKIVMQFDPLADSKKVQEDSPTETIVDRGISASKMTNPVSAAASPNLSLSSCSSPPKSPQLLDSPKTSHDVQFAMSEKARSGSSSSSSSKKKSGESRLKNTISSDSSRSNHDRGGTIGSTTSNNDGGSRSEPTKPKEVPFDFHKFLEQMRHRSALPISRYFQSFLKEFDRKPWTVNEQIKIIHDFLDFITGKMEMCDLWKNSSDQEFENVKEGMEKLVMNRLFS